MTDASGRASPLHAGMDLMTSTLRAHAAFFTDDAPRPSLEAALTTGPLLSVAAGFVAALVAWAVAARCADPRRRRCAVRALSEIVSGPLSSMTAFAPPIARIALGASLAWCAAVDSVATPGLRADEPVLDLLRLAALVLGLMLVVGVRVRASAVGSTAVFAVAAVLAGSPVVLLERLDVLGLAAFVAVVGGRRLDPRMDAATLGRLARGTTWLRVGIAAGLFTVAITEKLANVEMTAAVLAEHPRIDPGQFLGTDMATTVLMLGAVEVALAVLVLVLPLPELLALAVGAPFVLGVAEFGMLEVPGHLPIWGGVTVLALLGAHLQTADLVSVRPPWMRDVERTPELARRRTVGPRVPWVATGAEQVAPVPAAVPPMAPAPSLVPPMAPAASLLPPMPVPRPMVLVGSATGAVAPASCLPPVHPRGADLAVQDHVAAWRASAPIDAPRFEWAAAPGAGGVDRR